MNLSSVQGLYSPVGKERFNSLLKPAPKVKARRFIHEKSIETIVSIIRAHKKITRKLLMVKTELSRTTVEYAIQMLSEENLISKSHDKSVIGYPVTYSMSK